MQSHHDGDAAAGLRRLFDPKPANLDALQKRARELTANGQNIITAGAPGEEPIGVEETPHAFLTHLPDDPLALRISIGEGRDVPGSRYVVLRGDPAECLDLLERAAMALRLYNAKRTKKHERDRRTSGFSDA